MSQQQQDQSTMTIRLGHDELVIRHRYQIASILNDFFIGIWFLVGSILFFFPRWKSWEYGSLFSAAPSF